MSKTLIVTVGLPRSGKTTFAKHVGCPIVNPDSIRLAMHGQPFISEAEPFVWAVAKCMVRSLFLAGHDTVVLDATNTTRARRDEWKSSKWVRKFAILGDAAIRETCLTRVDSMDTDDNHKEGLRGAINRMADQYQAIAGDEIQDGESLIQVQP